VTTPRTGPSILACMLDRTSGAFLDGMTGTIRKAFAAQVKAVLMVLDLSPALDLERGQVEASRLMALLASVVPPPDDAKVVAITGQDLYIPALSFVLGEAQLGGRFAVVSLSRLRPTFYGLPEDDAVLSARTARECIHEVGHTFGLTHCPRRTCPMHASTSAEDLDVQEPRLCAECRRHYVTGAGRSSFAAAWRG
jgi:archaemetzincin